jgi:hypothetical protein
VKRYTATFRGPQEVAELRRSLDKQLYQSLPVYTLGEESRPEPELWRIELGSDGSPPAVRRALQRFGEQAGFTLAGLVWGWALSRAEPEPCGPEASSLLGRSYRVPLGRVWLTLAVYLGGILAWGWGLLFGVNDPARLWLALLLLVGWSFAASKIQVVFTLVSRLEIDEEGLEIGLWLPPWTRFLAWREVERLTLRPDGGGCEVSGAGKHLELPLRWLAGRDESRQLLRLVVCRARLVLVEDKPMGGGTYLRPDAV